MKTGSSANTVSYLCSTIAYCCSAVLYFCSPVFRLGVEGCLVRVQRVPHKGVPNQGVSYKGARSARCSLQRCKVYFKSMQGLLRHV